MNLPAYFTQQPEFRAFKDQIGSQMALEFLFNLGSRCQVEKKTELYLPLRYVGPALGFGKGDLEPTTVRAALLECGMLVPMEGKEDHYSVKLFTEHNAQLIQCWKNGRLGGRPAKAATVKEEDPF